MCGSMTAGRRLLALAFLGALLAAAVPLAADPCGAGCCCAAMRAAPARSACPPGAAWAPESSCCRTPAPPATAPSAALAASSALPAPEGAPVDRTDLFVAPQPAAALPVAARAVAERRHELGLFTLNSIYRI